MERTIISAEQIELWNSPVIASQLPIKFSTGFTFTGVVNQCVQCNRKIAEDAVHGKVLRPASSVVEVFAIGYCCDCNLLTPYRFRIYDDQRFATLGNEGWFQGKLQASASVRFFRNIQRAVRWLFTF